MNSNGKNLKGFQNFGEKKWLFWKFYWKSFQTRSKNRKANKSTRANAPVNSDLTIVQFNSVQSLSRVWLFATIMNPSMPGLPVHHHPPEFTQTHIHRVSDAIQPSHPLSSPSPPAPNPSQQQSLFQWVNSSHEVAKVLEFHISTSVQFSSIAQSCPTLWWLR